MLVFLLGLGCALSLGFLLGRWVLALAPPPQRGPRTPLPTSAPSPPPLTPPVRSGELITYYAAASTPAEDNRYLFLIRQEPSGKWRAYIRRTPSYCCRDSRAQTAHWLFDPAHGRYICLAGGDPDNKEALLEKALLWADKTQRYISTGKAMNLP